LSLLGVLVVICAITFAVSKYETHKENIKNSDTVILELDSDSVTALSWKNETTELSFHKDENWIYDDDEAFPVDEEKVNELLSTFEEFGVSFIIEDVEDYGQYGLDDPVCTIEITTNEQADDSETQESDTLEIKLGAFSKMDSKRYVSIGDGNVYLVNTDPLDLYAAELSDMIKNDEIPDLAQIDSITFTGDIAYHINYEEESGNSYQDEDVYFVSDGSNTLPLDTSLVNSYLRAVSSLDLTDYVSYNATDEDLASYGLDSPDLSVAIAYTYESEEQEEQEDTVVVHISRDPDEKAEAEAQAESEETDSEEETITAYVRIGDSRIVYKLDGSSYTTLMEATYNDLRHQSIYYGDFDDVTQIDILLDGSEYFITSEKDGDERTYYYEEEELDLTKLQSAIENLSADEFSEEEADGKEEIRLTLYLDNENLPQIEIVLYRHDGETCLAEVNGESVAYINRADAVELIEAVNAIIL
jgi:hypothetical protein